MDTDMNRKRDRLIKDIDGETNNRKRQLTRETDR